MSAILARKQPRRAFRREVLLACQVVRERDFRLVSDLAIDLSTDGMLVRSNQRILTGEELIVTFRAPRSYQWFDAQATVARVVHGRRPGDRGHCLGLVFHGMETEAKEDLFERLRGLPPPQGIPRLSIN
jgi:c-di-GMP-binding flagellar brake protein YcgR